MTPLQWLSHDSRVALPVHAPCHLVVLVVVAGPVGGAVSRGGRRAGLSAPSIGRSTLRMGPAAGALSTHTKLRRAGSKQLSDHQAGRAVLVAEARGHAQRWVVDFALPSTLR